MCGKTGVLTTVTSHVSRRGLRGDKRAFCGHWGNAGWAILHRCSGMWKCVLVFLIFFPENSLSFFPQSLCAIFTDRDFLLILIFNQIHSQVLENLISKVKKWSFQYQLYPTCVTVNGETMVWPTWNPSPRLMLWCQLLDPQPGSLIWQLFIG